MMEALKSLAPPTDAATFAAARAKARELGGSAALCSELQTAGFVEDGRLTTGTKPFNIFARVGAGVMTQPNMEEENAALGATAGSQFVVACNRPENDEHWANADPEWVGKASMAERHRFLTTKDMAWQMFNVLSYGLDGDAASLAAAVETLEALQAAAHTFATATPSWSTASLGLYFHCYPHNSVNSLHLHMVDLSATGPTFDALSYKNLPLDAVLTVLKAELAEAEAALTQAMRGLEEVLSDAINNAINDANDGGAAAATTADHARRVGEYMLDAAGHFSRNLQGARVGGVPPPKLAGAEPSKAELQALFEKAYAQAGAAKLQAALSSVLL